MLDSSDLVAFLATADAGRARQFYEGILGLPLVSDDPFALVFDAHGVELRLTKVAQPVVAPYTVLGWKVTDIASAAAALAGRGVAFERYEGLEQDAQGIWRSPGGGRVAWFKDPDGHTLSLTQAES